jgi:hypothetical protein
MVFGQGRGYICGESGLRGRREGKEKGGDSFFEVKVLGEGVIEI